MENSESSTNPGRSAVDFDTRMRAHLGVPVRNLEASIRYYETLLGMPPTKVRPGYAKFEVAEPPLNLALNESETPETHHPARHFGVQVKSVEEVQVAHGKLRAAGFATMNEEGTTCCFAVQDKVWSVDPDGNRWEVFVVLDDNAATHSLPQPTQDTLPGEAPKQENCCA